MANAHIAIEVGNAFEEHARIAGEYQRRALQTAIDHFPPFPVGQYSVFIDARFMGQAPLIVAPEGPRTRIPDL